MRHPRSRPDREATPCLPVAAGPSQVSRRSALVISVCLVGGALGCEKAPPNDAGRLGPAADRTTLGPGDLFQLEIVGESDLPKEYQVAADGTVTLPYVHTMTAAGFEPHEFARQVREALISKNILTDPSVVVTVKEYRSKFVTLLGQVQRPGSFPLSPGMTLLQAISLSGGFTSLAKTDQVSLTRKATGGTTTVVLDVEDIYEGRSPDIELQPGDRVFVRERVF